MLAPSCALVSPGKTLCSAFSVDFLSTSLLRALVAISSSAMASILSIVGIVKSAGLLGAPLKRYVRTYLGTYWGLAAPELSPINPSARDQHESVDAL